MWGLALNVAGKLIGAGSNYLKRKQTIKQNWESSMAKNANKSYMDDLWTLIFASPVVFIVFGAVADSFGYYQFSQAGQEMIVRLNLLFGENNFTYILSSVVLAAFGIRWDGKRRKNRMLEQHLEDQRKQRDMNGNGTQAVSETEQSIDVSRKEESSESPERKKKKRRKWKLSPTDTPDHDR